MQFFYVMIFDARLLFQELFFDYTIINPGKIVRRHVILDDDALP